MSCTIEFTNHKNCSFLQLSKVTLESKKIKTRIKLPKTKTKKLRQSKIGCSNGNLVCKKVAVGTTKSSSFSTYKYEKKNNKIFPYS